VALRTCSAGVTCGLRVLSTVRALALGLVAQGVRSAELLRAPRDRCPADEARARLVAPIALVVVPVLTRSQDLEVFGTVVVSDVVDVVYVLVGAETTTELVFHDESVLEVAAAVLPDDDVACFLEASSARPHRIAGPTSSDGCTRLRTEARTALRDLFHVTFAYDRAATGFAGDGDSWHQRSPPACRVSRIATSYASDAERVSRQAAH